jgi:transposase
LTDLPAQGRPIRVELLARRFFCPAADCPRRLFVERLPGVVATHRRTTDRMSDAHGDSGFALGGEAGARRAARLAMPTSPDTLLHRVRNARIPKRPFVPDLGVDDWAFRKGQRYCTILCDLERRCPVDLLPERSAEALCDWVKDHPKWRSSAATAATSTSGVRAPALRRLCRSPTAGIYSAICATP